MPRARVVAAPVLCLALALTALGCTGDAEESTGAPSDGAQDAAMVSLGRSVFFDENLSIRKNQSCATCHVPAAGWAVGEERINASGAVYEGSLPETFGTRRPMTAAYAVQTPVFHMVEPGVFAGGAFWDGRATGETTGDPTAEQARAPFVNPKEQALPDTACVVHRVLTADYPTAYGEVWNGPDIDWPKDVASACADTDGRVTLSDSDRAASDLAFDRITRAIAAFEGSSEVNAFTSKFDAMTAGDVEFTEQEQEGWDLFRGRAGCSGCHDASGRRPLFTNHGYANIGIPPNPDNPAYTDNQDFLDLGLGGFLLSRPELERYAAENFGRFKIPTLRNVDMRVEPGAVKAFGHNGYFKSLESIVHFHNSRDTLQTCADAREPEEGIDCWPSPEYPENLATQVGDLGLSLEQEEAIVALLRTLTDGYVISPS